VTLLIYPGCSTAPRRLDEGFTALVIGVPEREV
jgi:hypothetical protein